MKKIVLIALLAVTGSAFGQVSKGSLFLGGGLGFQTESSKTTFKATATTVDNPSMNRYWFDPEVGYFLTDRLAAGLMLHLGGSNSGVTDSTKDKRTEFGLGLFARYYMGINEKFYFWPQLDVMFGSSNRDVTAANVTVNTDKGSFFAVGITPGFSYFPSTRYGLNFGVGRLGMRSSKDIGGPGTPGETTTKTSNFDFMWDMRAITIGVTVFLGGGGGAQ